MSDTRFKMSVFYKKGQKVKKLTFIKEIGEEFVGKKKLRMGLFKCDCGKVHKTPLYWVASGRKSCMCKSKTHGLRQHYLYDTWSDMKNRCYNPNNSRYEHWGGRGITVCERWKDSFPNFLEDMGDRPSNKHQLDRFPDNDGNYEPSNCRWATRKQQANNKRNNIQVVYNGIKIRLSNLCDELKIDAKMVRYRLRLGWTIERAVSQQKRKRSMLS